MANGGLQNLPKARVVAVIFGFPLFVFNELSWNPSQWFDVKIFFLEKIFFSVFLGTIKQRCFSCVKCDVFK